ncbi:coniferyl aldehyde dehydrogenase [uncultured Christiangramia sp.]|uniref:coniferyl aldehyde dehydrogenase n=1 Tax=uncultured Christiangramia sp. TaxID=503836 RepID=UPI002634CB63|nr:coniferyl aldehyde dehydrogenase [uncultured Christiangramia sp.]
MTAQELSDLLKIQQKAFTKSPPGYEQRMEALASLSEMVEKNQERLIEAVSQDFGHRSSEETTILELFPLHDEIKHARRHLKSWMKRKSVRSSWFLLPSTAYYQFQPLGSVGIMGAWNYQVLLTLSPLVDAIAAGNHAIIKPSEIAPASAEVIRELINDTFDSSYIYCVTGDAELAKDFSSLPFDHLFFTGSTRVGKLIMEAAAPNLTPVTLELGGKSPAIIHESYDLELAAKRIMAGKLFNAGQTCVAPDYLVMPADLNDKFIEYSKQVVEKFYPDIANNKQYSYIISDKHFKRLTSLLEEAKQKGAKIIELCKTNELPEGMMTPKLVLGVNDEMAIMQEEIFGPLLPVLNRESVEQGIEYVNANAKPLALYYFDDNQDRIDHLLKFTLSGGVTINDTIYHLAQHRLPFGGVGASGMGHYHGFDGFKTFSKKRAVMQQKKFAATDILHPPYTDIKKKLIGVMGDISKV